jgi:5-methyltetrahydrofolate--homocysteine methyltransferase
VNPLFEQLLAHKPVVTDGAWGTEMQARGLPIGGCPDAWNLTNPERVEEVARAYVEAGSRVILTNTFGANRFTLERHGLAARVLEVNRAGAAISKRAANGRAKVFASIGPTGRMLAMGEVTREELRSAFRDQAAALAEGGADALVVETMTDLDEARLALDAAKSTGLPVVVSMVFGVGGKADRTIMGITPEQAACELEECGADAIGANCGIGADAMVPLCERFWMATDLPIWIKPNAGLPEVVDGKAVYQTSPAEFTHAALALVRAGASFIGGCCGTSPALIASLSKHVG